MCTDIGISKGTLTDLKSGRKKGISAANAQKIASYFDVSVGYLLGEEEQGGSAPDQTSWKLTDTGYEQLNETNKKLIDQLIAQLLKAQSID